jgi:hypothetical protein
MCIHHRLHKYTKIATLGCSNYVSYENKKIVFRTRDTNSSINILKLTKCWIEKKTRPTEFQNYISSLTFSITKKKKKK